MSTDSDGGSAIWGAESVINIDSGTVSAMGTQSIAVFNSGGTVTITGGNISAAGTESIAVWSGSGNVTIYGGNFSTTPACFGIRLDGGTISILGGSFSFPNPSEGIVVDGGTLNIYGSNFNYPYGPISARGGTLTGILADGESIDISFARSNGSIVLIPEPTSAAVVAVGCVAVAATRRRMK